MDFLRNVLASMSGIIHQISSRNNVTESHINKRPRPSDDENFISLDDESPPKRLRFDDTFLRRGTLMEITHRRNSSTQTFSDNEVIVVDDDKTVSPSKFKNAYKAPKHVRSVRIAFRSPATIDLTSPDDDHLKSLSHSRSRSQSSRKIVRSATWSMAEAMSRDEYGRLLGSILSDGAKRRLKRIKPKATAYIDLTDDNEDVVDLTRNEAPKSSTGMATITSSPFPTSSGSIFSRSRYQDKNRTIFSRNNVSSVSGQQRTPIVTVRPIVIDEESPRSKIVSPKLKFSSEFSSSLSSNDKSHMSFTSPRPRVQRVNSFQEKIDGLKCSKSDFLPKLEDHSATLLKASLNLRKQLEAEAQLAAEIAEAAVIERVEQRLQAHLKITEALLEEEEDVEVDTVLPALTDEQMAKIRYAQNRSLNPNEILISKFRLDIRRTDLLSLSGLSWLNDNVINFYMELLAERSLQNDNYPSVYAFNTFFYSTLSANGYQRVRRFTKKVDIFEKDLILVPVHLSVHWCMAKIDMRKKEVVYYDSMHGTNQNALDVLMDYIASEHKDKKNAILDMSGWSAQCDKTVPAQQNGSDCGVFACTFAEYSSRRAKFNFTQENMPYMRMKMVYEICTGALLTK